MKNILSTVHAIVVIVGALSGCTNQTTSTTEVLSEEFNVAYGGVITMNPVIRSQGRPCST
jgi:hypothetical protein